MRLRESRLPGAATSLAPAFLFWIGERNPAEPKRVPLGDGWTALVPIRDPLKGVAGADDHVL
jgi:hypothetical protein